MMDLHAKDRLSLINILFFIFLLLSSLRLQAAQPDFGAEHYILQSDLIVEGVVVGKERVPAKEIPEYMHTTSTSINVKFKAAQAVKLQVLKCFKGGLTENQIITIFTHLGPSEDVLELKEQKRYLLFLKKHVFKTGYVLVDLGKASWRIFDYNGLEKLQTWRQGETLRSVDSYQDYSAFISTLVERIGLSAEQGADIK